jgi:hypothetical protein
MRLRVALATLTIALSVSALAQHDITQVDPVGRDGAVATPVPVSRGYRKYDTPDMAGAKQAIGSQLIEGRLPKPLVDFITAEGAVEQRVSIFEGGLVVIHMTGGATIRKRMLIPEHALKSYMKAISMDALSTVDQQSLALPEPTRRSRLRVHDAGNGKFVERVFHPSRVLPKSLQDQVTPLRDLLRAISEDRNVTSSVAGYEPQPGDELVADDQRIYRVIRIIDGAGVVELKCLEAPTTIYVAKKDLHLYFVGRPAQ